MAEPDPDEAPWARWLAKPVVVTMMATTILVAAILSAFGPGRSGQPGFAPGNQPGMTDPMRTAAMLSVNAHARWPMENQRKIDVIPLGDAISILVRDAVPAAASRRRRAAAALAAYGLALEDKELKFERFTDELWWLGADPSALLEYLDLDRSKLIKSTGVLISPEVLELLIGNYLVFLTPQCQWQRDEVGGGVGTDPPPVVWEFTANIPRTVAEVARTFDPQKWDEACSPYFPRAYFAEGRENCCEEEASEPICELDRDSDGRALPADERGAGRPHENTLFYEEFSADSRDGEITFHNALCTSAGYDIFAPWQFLTKWANRYELRFDLVGGRWLYSSVLGVSQKDGDEGFLHYRITADYGWIRIEETDPPESSSPPLVAALVGSTDEWVNLTSRKELEFESGDVTETASQALWLVQKEMAHALVDQACCAVPVESWAWPFTWLKKAFF